MGRFQSMEVGQHAEVVRWRVAMDPDIRAGLLTHLLNGKKRNLPRSPPTMRGGRAAAAEAERPPRAPRWLQLQRRRTILMFYITIWGEGREMHHPIRQPPTTSKVEGEPSPSTSRHQQREQRPNIGAPDLWIRSPLGPYRRRRYQKWGADPSAETFQDFRKMDEALQRATMQDVGSISTHTGTVWPAQHERLRRDNGIVDCRDCESSCRGGGYSAA